MQPTVWFQMCRLLLPMCFHLRLSWAEQRHNWTQAKCLQLPGWGKEKRKGKQRWNLIQTWYQINSCGTILLPFLEGKPWELLISSGIPVCTHSWDEHARGPCYMCPDSTARSESNKNGYAKTKGDYFGTADIRPGIRNTLQIHGKRACKLTQSAGIPILDTHILQVASIVCPFGQMDLGFLPFTPTVSASTLASWP